MIASENAVLPTATSISSTRARRTAANGAACRIAAIAKSSVAGARACFLLDVNRIGHGGFPCSPSAASEDVIAKGYSKDLRERAVAMVEDGDRRRETSRLLNLAASTAVPWLDRWSTTGTVEAKPGTGHSRSGQ